MQLKTTSTSVHSKLANVIKSTSHVRLGQVHALNIMKEKKNKRV